MHGDCPFSTMIESFENRLSALLIDLGLCSFRRQTLIMENKDWAECNKDLHWKIRVILKKKRGLSELRSMKQKYDARIISLEKEIKTAQDLEQHILDRVYVVQSGRDNMHDLGYDAKDLDLIDLFEKVHAVGNELIALRREGLNFRMINGDVTEFVAKYGSD